MADLDGTQATEAVRIVGAATDGTEESPVKAYDNQELATGDVISVGGTNGEVTGIGTTAQIARVGVSNYLKRKFVRIYNNGTTTLYWGFKSNTSDSGVNAGEPIRKKTWVTVGAKDNVDVYVVSSAAAGSAIITEGG